MARYYFDTDDGTLALVDDVGVDLPHDTAAQMEMLRILRELFEGIKMQSGSAKCTVDARREGNQPIGSATAAFEMTWGQSEAES